MLVSGRGAFAGIHSMATNAQLGANLLRNAAKFFRNVGAQNSSIEKQMEKNAAAYDVVAGLVEKDPTGEAPVPPRIPEPPQPADTEKS